MAKEIYIYESIFSFTAKDFIKEMESAKDEDVTIRVNTNGGSPEDGYGMIAKFIEHSKAKKVKIDGKALSMGLFFCAFANDVEALDVSEFLLHRAAYPSWIEKDRELFTNDMKESLSRMNDKLRQALEAKINTEKFKEITGYTLNDVFSMDGQLDVYMTAEQAKEINLIDRVVNITPERRAEITRLSMKAAAHIDEARLKNAAKKSKESNVKLNPIKMNIDKLKAEHPELYKQVFDAGVSAEKDRVMSFMAWHETDAEAVKEGIAKGEQMTQAKSAEFAVKMAKANNLAALEAEGKKNNPGEQEEKETKEKTAEEKKTDEFLAEVDKLNKEKTA